MSITKEEFNNFRFEGLEAKHISNTYLSMKRFNPDKTKIVVKVGSDHLRKTKYGFILVLDNTHVVFIKTWQVDQNHYGNEVLLTKEFFKVREYGEWEEFSECKENLEFETWVKVAEEQEALKDEKGIQLNPVKWRG